MLRLLKYLSVGLLAVAVQSAFGFALVGPNNEAFEIPALGYNPNANLGNGLPTGPKNLGEEYRRNTPTLYYALDANFLDYFGSNGVAAVEQAVGILNSLTNVSDYSHDLREFPLNTQRQNYQAALLSLVDLKSIVLKELVMQVGMDAPERWVWCIHDRYIPPGGACRGPFNADTEYLVVKRNFDPVTMTYSSYVNGALYSFQILEYCTAANSPAPPAIADAEEFSVDPLADAFTSVAGSGDVWGFAVVSGLQLGGFYTGLTRDDVGCLRYLLVTNNVNMEDTGPGTIAFVTNATPQLLVTSNLNLFLSQALTNNDGPLAALYPGLAYTAPATPIFTNIGVPNIVLYFTNKPTDPYGTLPTPVVQTNGYTTNVVTYYEHHFANVVTNTFYTNSIYSLLQTNITADPTAPFGSGSETNVTMISLVSHDPGGDFYIIPTNLCGFDIVRTQLATSGALTNLQFVFTTTTTNAAGTSTNGTYGEVSQSVVEYFTNRILVVKPITCPASPTNLMQGIERLHFTRVNYDSLLGQFFEPITNTYTLMTVTNNVLKPITVQRVLTTPDFVFSAQDQVSSGVNTLPTRSLVTVSINFDTNNEYANLAGPGTVIGPTRISFDKTGPVYLSLAPTAFLQQLAESSASLLSMWGSFDGSTNAPIVYPDGTSIENLENQVLMHPDVPMAMMAPGTNGVPYSFQLTGVGGQPPYTWSLAPGSSALPPGLTGLSTTNISTTGIISGTPTESGTFDFVLRMNDSSARTVDWSMSILIKPQ